MRNKAPKENARQSIEVSKAKIDAMLARLLKYSQEQYGCIPESADWGDAGVAAEIASNLKKICDFTFCEGECAE